MFIENRNILSWKDLVAKLPKSLVRTQWKNIGGQLIPEPAVNSLIRSVRGGKVNSWDQVHELYIKKSNNYPVDKFQHAFASLLEILKIRSGSFTKKVFVTLLRQAVATREWMTTGIYESRAKDYQNPFRQMVYDTQKEMDNVLGKLKDNSFILQQQEEYNKFKKQVENIIMTLAL